MLRNKISLVWNLPARHFAPLPPHQVLYADESAASSVIFKGRRSKTALRQDQPCGFFAEATDRIKYFRCYSTDASGSITSMMRRPLSRATQLSKHHFCGDVQERHWCRYNPKFTDFIARELDFSKAARIQPFFTPLAAPFPGL